LGELALRLVNENRGATERTLQLLSNILANPAGEAKRIGSLHKTRSTK
jgi:hypothetical protein